MLWDRPFLPIIVVFQWLFSFPNQQSQVLCGFKHNFHIGKVVWINLAFVNDFLSASLKELINLLFVIHDEPDVLIFVKGPDESPPSPDFCCKFLVLIHCNHGWVLVNGFDRYAFAVQMIEDFSALQVFVKVKLRVKRRPLFYRPMICLWSAFWLE